MRSGKRLLNVGCGPHPAEGFINIDLDWKPGIDLCWDLQNGVPLPDEYVHYVYTEHCLEHFSRELAARVLRELHRVMVTGAIIRVIVPDAELYLDLYQKCKREVVAFPYVEREKLACGEITPLMAINHMIFHYGHLYMYDFATLRKFLLDAGFREVERKRFGDGSSPHLLDSPERECESLYVEARK